MMRRFLVALLLGVSAIVLIPTDAYACSNPVACPSNGVDGVVTRLSEEQLHRLGAQLAQQIAAGGPHFEYKTYVSCNSNTGSFDLGECYKTALLCPGDPGPLVDILRRKVDAAGKELSPWTRIGQTCRPNDVPGAKPRPTTAMIIHAMHLTPWAKASIGFQPAGYKTLVNLPSYYAASWSRNGFGPGEVENIIPATMYGYNVQIRPKLLGLTYHFGDGQSVGPTTSLGGVYPTGDIRHTYLTKGSYSAHVTVQWGADFSIDGSPWYEVPDTVTVDQPAATITVAEAHARLVR